VGCDARLLRRAVRREEELARNLPFASDGFLDAASD
jgi:hypothetical protein